MEYVVNLTIGITKKDGKYTVKIENRERIVSLQDFKGIETAWYHLKNFVGVSEADSIIEAIIADEIYK